MYGLFHYAVTNIYEIPNPNQFTDNKNLSYITDEGLHGMGVAITGIEENGFLPVRTHYNYTGYVKKEELHILSLEELQAWENSDLMVVNAFTVDVLSFPNVQAVRLITLTKGAIVQILEWETELGWAKIRLADGRFGYIKNQQLTMKKFSQKGLWKEKLPQYEKINVADFRKQVVAEALKYYGIQYRWGGKTTLGIDCSGLTSMCYMFQGILIYRDAKIVAGFPMKDIPVKDKKKGDLLYFPGHIAMYIGGDRYIHSTAKKGSDGVVINSLNPQCPDYREDLAKVLYAVGSIF